MDNIVVFIQNDIPKANVLELNMLNDIFKSHNVCVLRENSKDKITDLLSRRSIQKATKGTLDFLYINRYEIIKFLKKNHMIYSNIYFFFLNTSFTTVRYPISLFNFIKRKYGNVHFTLFYIDTCSRDVSTYANYLVENKVFDLVYTFDSLDAKNYNFYLWETPYSKLYESIPEVVYDLYFGGVEAERGNTIKQLIYNARDKHVNISMDIVTDNVNSVLINLHEHIVIRSYDNLLDYKDMLHKTLEAKCILEIVRQQQAGLTLRAYEAIVYNKKLLTNNPTILKSPYYNSNYIHYFKNIEDIDWRWVKNDVDVNYNYQNDFSPSRLITDMIDKLNKPN